MIYFKTESTISATVQTANKDDDYTYGKKNSN